MIQIRTGYGDGVQVVDIFENEKGEKEIKGIY